MRVQLGVSPRASLTLAKLCKARALFTGRTFVSPDDVQELTLYALSHRIRLEPEADFEGVRASTVVQDVLKSTPYHGPREPKRSYS